MQIHSISSVNNFNGLWHKGVAVPLYSFEVSKNGKILPQDPNEICFVNAYYPFADETKAQIEKNTLAYKDKDGMLHVAIIEPAFDFTQDEFCKASQKEIEEMLPCYHRFSDSREREDEFDFCDCYVAKIRKN